MTSPNERRALLEASSQPLGCASPRAVTLQRLMESTGSRSTAVPPESKSRTAHAHDLDPHHDTARPTKQARLADALARSCVKAQMLHGSLLPGIGAGISGTDACSEQAGAWWDQSALSPSVTLDAKMFGPASGPGTRCGGASASGAATAISATAAIFTHKNHRYVACGGLKKNVIRRPCRCSESSNVTVGKHSRCGEIDANVRGSVL